MARPIGIYEKATPKHFTWLERLNFAKELGFDFVELSIDESDERLARLDWSKKERLELVKAIFETGFPPLLLADIAVIHWDPTILKKKRVLLK